MFGHTESAFLEMWHIKHISWQPEYIKTYCRSQKVSKKMFWHLKCYYQQGSMVVLSVSVSTRKRMLISWIAVQCNSKIILFLKWWHFNQLEKAAWAGKVPLLSPPFFSPFQHSFNAAKLWPERFCREQFQQYSLQKWDTLSSLFLPAANF